MPLKPQTPHETMPDRPYGLYIFAHNEEAAIEATLGSVLMQEGADETDIHVMVNGSTDGTADRVRTVMERHAGVHLHDILEGGKSNAWNEAVHGLEARYRLHFFMDGDLTLVPGALAALRTALEATPHANAASGVPHTGRTRAAQLAELLADPGITGGLYALTGAFVDRMRESGTRLPIGMVGDDALLGVYAATDLAPLPAWDKSRILVVPEAGFLFEPLSPFRLKDLKQQVSRLRRYGRRTFENRLIAALLKDRAPSALPRHIAGLYAWGMKNAPEALKLRPRGYRTLFDWLALRDIRRMAAAHREQG